MDIKIICPLGSQCEEIKDNQIHRCRWYIALRGKCPQSEELIDKWGCAIEWLPTLLIENAQTNRGQTQSLESFRNEMVNGQNVFNGILQVAVKKRSKEVI